MSDSPVRVAAVRRIGAAPRAAETDSDLVAAEEPLQLEIEHGPLHARRRLNAGVLLRTPGRDADLAAGLLFAEGFIAGRRDIQHIDMIEPGLLRVQLSAHVELDGLASRRVLIRSSACGLCGRDATDDLAGAGVPSVREGPAIPASLLRGLPGLLRARQTAFDETGGLHAAAFFDASGRLTSSAEDIGRHNAVDKLIGAALLTRAPGSTGTTAPTEPAILLVSGRAAFEIVQKAVRAGVPVLAAVGAPSSLAVETARAFNLTLVGFLREARFNVYSGFGRIV